MSKQENRQIRLRLEEQNQMHAALTTPRHPHADMTFRGIGPRLVQVLYSAPWEPLSSWDIRMQSDYVLYRSASVSAESDLLLGYEQLAADPRQLQKYVERLLEINLPIIVPYEPFAIADGDRTEVALFGGIQASSRFEWRGGAAPSGWGALEKIVTEMIEYFRAVAPEKGEA